MNLDLYCTLRSFINVNAGVKTLSVNDGVKTSGYRGEDTVSKCRGEDLGVPGVKIIHCTFNLDFLILFIVGNWT